MFSAYDYLSAYDRHKKLINDYFELRGGSALSLQRDTSRDKTDYDVIKENHKFLWNEENERSDESWEKRLAKKYYDKLFKEYCLCDLTRYKYNKVALRWRTESEVVAGKGQFECANKKCKIKDALGTWEVNFGYEEDGEKKNALVKLRLCPECSRKLNYKSKKREIKRKRLGKLENREEASSSGDKNDIKLEPESDLEIVEKSNKVKTEEAELWRSKNVECQEKTREEEFEEYLADLFL